MKTAEKYLNSKGLYNTNRLRNCFDEEITITDMLREYALEAIKADRERVAEKAKIAFHCGTTKITHSISHYQSGADNIQIDKQSILNLSIKLK